MGNWILQYIKQGSLYFFDSLVQDILCIRYEIIFHNFLADKIKIFNSALQDDISYAYGAVLGQFDPGQFGPRTIWYQDNLVLGQFGTWKIRYQDNSVLGQFDPGQIVTRTIRYQENLVPDNEVPIPCFCYHFGIILLCVAELTILNWPFVN